MAKELKLYKVPEINSIQDMLVKSAEKYNDKLALEDLTGTPISRVTYSQLLDNVLRFGNALRKAGISERTHIAVIGENRVQWTISYLTLMSFNYIIVPIDKNLTTNEIMNIVRESDSEAIIFTENFEETFRYEKYLLKKLRWFISMDLPSGKEGFLSMTEMINNTSPMPVHSLPKINTDELAEIIFTSGSLGRAKGVMLTQGNLATNLMAMTSMIFMYPEDRFLSVLPIHHTYESTCGMLCPIYSGSSVHYARSLKTIVEDIQKVKATMLLAVPLLYDKMFKRIYKTINEDKIKSLIIKPMIVLTNIAEVLGWKGAKKKIFHELHERFGGHIRMFIAGGAAPDPDVAKGLREFGFNFIQGYGLTETAPISALNRLDDFKDDAAGLPMPGVQIKINEPSADGTGEIYIKGPNVMPGYYKNEKLTGEAFDNGWFKSGDVGYFDSDGFLHISGRKKNVIISRTGENVFPEEIEDIINRDKFVQESYIYGEADAKLDEIIAVQLVMDGEALIEYSEINNVPITPELIQQLASAAVKKTNEQLPAFKQIRKFYVREREFEKTTTQKIKRYLIKKNVLTEQE